MKNYKKIEKLINKLKNSNYAELLDKIVLGDIENGYNNYKESRQRLESEDKILTIGIVGQVKAGKSSFLNALFFDSKEILPKAATPMTAALTKIRYSENISAKVHFFNLNDWETIEKGYKECKFAISKERDKINENLLKKNKPATASSDIELLNGIGLSDSSKSFYEIYENFKKHEKELSKKLKNSIEDSRSGDNYETIEGVDTIDALKNKLENYVGANGKYTPIVKYVEIFLNVEAIKEFDIVDTPGLNDPVISRGTLTRNFLGKCDVIFLLSPASQFFDSQDISLFSEQLPQEGIKEVVVIGSKFDNGIIGESKKYNGDIKVAQIKVKETLNEEFNARIEGSDRKEIFKKAFPPRYISSICYDIYKHYGSLSKNEKHAKEQITDAFPHFTDNAENFRKLSNIEIFEAEIIPKIVEKKEKILEERKNNVYSAFIDKFKNSMEKLHEEVKRKQDKFSNEDIKFIEKKLESSLKNLEKIKNKITGCFNDETHEVKRKFEKLKKDIRDTIDRNKEVKEYKKTVTVEKDGIGGGIGRFFGGIFGKDWGYETENISYALIQDSIEKISKMVGESQELISQAFENIFDVKNFCNTITDNLISVLNLADLDFDTDSITIPLKKVLNDMTFSPINLKRDYSDIIHNELHNVNETTPENMRKVIWKITNNILEDIEKLVNNETSNIISELDKKADNIIKETSKEMEKDAEELENQLKDKKKYEEMYKEAVSDIEEIKNNI